MTNIHRERNRKVGKTVLLENEIVRSVDEIFSTMIMLEVTSPAGEMSQNPAGASNLTSIVGLAGGVKGVALIHCPEEVAIGITTSFLGITLDTIDEDVKDAIGELANMVTGNIKDYFLTEKITTELSIPTTVVGKSFRTSGLSGARQVIVPFSCEYGVFWVELKYIIIQ